MQFTIKNSTLDKKEQDNALTNIPIFVIDDDQNSINAMKNELKNSDFRANSFIIKYYTNSNPDVELNFISDVLNQGEAIIIADYNMGENDRNGIVLMNHIMNQKPGNEYHCYLFTGKMKGNEEKFRKDNEQFEGKIYNKRKDGFVVLLLDIRMQIEMYKGYKQQPNRLDEWGEIISIIDNKLEILENPPKGKKEGNLIFDGVSYKFSEMRKEIQDTNSEVGKNFVISFLHGMLKNDGILAKYNKWN